MKQQQQLQNHYHAISSQAQQIPECIWSKMLPKKFVISSYGFKLSSSQVSMLVGTNNNDDDDNQGDNQKLQSDQQQQMSKKQPTKKQQYHNKNKQTSNQIFTSKQTEQIASFIDKSPQKYVFLKLNNRTPKDLDPFLQKINSIQDLLTVLKTSQYILETIEQSSKQKQHQQQYQFILRQFHSDIYKHKHHYQVYIKGGVTIAVIQRFRDHIGVKPSLHQLEVLLGAIQTVLPGLTISVSGYKNSSKNKHSQLKQQQKLQPNCLIVKLFCKQNMVKILGVHLFISDCPLHCQSLVSQQQLLQQYSQRVDPVLHGKQAKQLSLNILNADMGASNSANNINNDYGQTFDTNQGIIPLLKFVVQQKDVKAYDMGEYKMGNQILNEQMLSEWNQFTKQAQQKFRK